MPTDSWNPEQYHRFQAERAQPFFDLLAMVKPVDRPRVVDLGCGTGELTAELHRKLGARETLGIDSSVAMLTKASAHASATLRFEPTPIERFAPKEPFEVVFSNAALQWLPDHDALLERMTPWVAPGGQLLVQVPANHDHVSHLLAARVASQSPFRELLKNYIRINPVLAPERYAERLESLGYREQSVRLQVYGHHLPDREAVIEWVKGTLLTDYLGRLAPEHHDAFLRAYREELFNQLPDVKPTFYPFKRILFWARR
jgi:trans-aconitate 2-methyltransferase